MCDGGGAADCWQEKLGQSSSVIRQEKEETCSRIAPCYAHADAPCYAHADAPCCAHADAPCCARGCGGCAHADARVLLPRAGCRGDVLPHGRAHVASEPRPDPVLRPAMRTRTRPAMRTRTRRTGKAAGASAMDGQVGEGRGLVRERQGEFSYRACGAGHPARRLPPVQLHRLPSFCLRCRRCYTRRAPPP